jgi:hypothetical protein
VCHLNGSLCCGAGDPAVCQRFVARKPINGRVVANAYQLLEDAIIIVPLGVWWPLTKAADSFGEAEKCVAVTWTLQVVLDGLPPAFCSTVVCFLSSL